MEGQASLQVSWDIFPIFPIAFRMLRERAEPIVTLERTA